VERVLGIIAEAGRPLLASEIETGFGGNVNTMRSGIQQAEKRGLIRKAGRKRPFRWVAIRHGDHAQDGP
jgi:hypothetical protein